MGHTNASRIFDSYLVTVGHGAVLVSVAVWLACFAYAHERKEMNWACIQCSSCTLFPLCIVMLYLLCRILIAPQSERAA